MAAYRRFMTHVTCRLTAKNRDQLRNSMLGKRVWATFFFTNNSLKSSKSNEKRVSTSQLIFSGKRYLKCTASQSEKRPHARTHRRTTEKHKQSVWRVETYKLSPRGRRDDMPPPADDSSTRGGSTSVRGRVRSPHISGGRRADSLGSCAMLPA